MAGAPTPSTGNFQFSPMVVHILGLAGFLLVLLFTDKDFMALFPPAVAVVAKPLVAFLTYLGVTQVKAV